MSGTEVTTEVQTVDTDNLDDFATDFFGENKVAEPAAKQEPEPEEADPAPTEDDAEAQTTELTDEDEADAEAELAKEPKKSKVQERIDELVKQREDAKREAAAELAKLRKEFEDKIAALQPAPKAETKTTEPTPEALNEDGSAKYPLGEFDPLFIRDLTRYTLAEERAQAEIRAQEQRQISEQEVAQAALQTSWNEKLTVAKEKYPDLATKGQELLDGFNDLDQNYAGYLATVLMSMDYGPDVLNYLSINPDEARKIVNSGAQKATLALGRIEAKFAEVEAQKVIAKPKVSNAPPPPPVQARGTGGGAKTVEPDTDDLDAFTAAFFAKNKRRA